jgi:heme transport system ATP-binding protein
MSVLTLSKLCASPWGSPLLRDIDLQLERGQLLAVIGPNGAGKSSLLHAVAGGMVTDSGEIVLGEKPLQEWPDLERARALAMQAQHSALNFPFTVEEVVLLGRIPHGSGSATDRGILNEVLEATDTTSLRHRLFTQLSGGEKQRVQLARAVAQVWRSEDAPCRLLLLDEPSSALDLSHQRMVLNLVRQLASEGVAVIISTHDFNLVAAGADQVLVLQQGAQYSCGSPVDVLSSEMFSQVFEVQVLLQVHPEKGSPLVIQR